MIATSTISQPPLVLLAPTSVMQEQEQWADVKEYPNSFVFIKVQVEEGNILVISGERKREEKEGVKYVGMERRIGKFMRMFVLPENANTEKISTICQDGVLTVTVEKLPPPEPKKPKLIQVNLCY